MKERRDIRAEREKLRQMGEAEGVADSIINQAVIANDLETNYDRKKRFQLQENVSAFIKYHGLNQCAFMTVTFPDNLTCPKEAQERFHNWYTNTVTKHRFLGQYVMVLEPQKRGAVHYHLIVDCGEDVRTGFDFESFNKAMDLFSKRQNTAEYRKLTKAYAKSASDRLRFLWDHFRHGAPSYGVGMVQIVPLKSTSEAVGSYVAKYISKTLCYQGENFKGARLVRYSPNAIWRTHKSGFVWHSPGSAEWRGLVARAAAAIGAKHHPELAAMMGPRWAYWFMVYLDAGWDPETIAVFLVRKHLNGDGQPKPLPKPDLWALGLTPLEAARMKGSEKRALFERYAKPLFDDGGMGGTAVPSI